MGSINIGWEVSSAQGTGNVMAVPVMNNITLTGLQVDCSIGFPSGKSGFAEALCQGWILTPAAWPLWNVPGGPHQYVNTPLDPNFGTPGFAGAGQMGGAGASGCLFSIILKAWAPGGAGRGIFVPLDIPVVAGSGIFFHMDQAGTVTDMEMQGALFYK